MTAAVAALSGQPLLLLFFLLLLVLQPLPSAARPCPATAVFMHSYKHGRAFCVCGPGLECVGRGCDYGRAYGRLSPSFTAADVGFPISCTDCRSAPRGVCLATGA